MATLASEGRQAAPLRQAAFRHGVALKERRRGVPGGGGALFEDDELPARWYSLARPFDAASWLRPHEIREKPQLFVEGSSRFDVHQGQLGDCWFLAACAALADRPDLLKQVIPEGQFLYGPGYDGSVKFRFWRLGTWEEIRIDDRIPVDAEGKPVYVSCKQEDEFWMPLLEKAFAKFSGKYKKIEGGFGCESLMKLTGFSIQNIEIRSITAEKNFHTIKDALDNGGLIVTAVILRGPGVPEAHAYTVNKAILIPKDQNNNTELRLLRIRNPWGNEVEWTGAWRDGDERWNKLSQETIQSMEYEPGKDGEYWMELEDFTNTFICASIATKLPQYCKDMKIVQEINGYWNDDCSGGVMSKAPTFFMNPQFLLWTFSAPDENCGNDDSTFEIYAEIMQEQDRKTGNMYRPIAIYIFEVGEACRKLSSEELQVSQPVACSDVVPFSGVRCRARLRPGRRYVLVPASPFPGHVGAFLLRLYAHHACLRLAALAP